MTEQATALNPAESRAQDLEGLAIVFGAIWFLVWFGTALTHWAVPAWAPSNQTTLWLIAGGFGAFLLGLLSLCLADVVRKDAH